MSATITPADISSSYYYGINNPTGSPLTVSLDVTGVNAYTTGSSRKVSFTDTIPAYTTRFYTTSYAHVSSGEVFLVGYVDGTSISGNTLVIIAPRYGSSNSHSITAGTTYSMSIDSNILGTWTAANVGTLRTFSRGPALTTTQYIYTALDASYRDYFYNNVRGSTLVTRSSATGQIVGGSLTLTYTPPDTTPPYATNITWAPDWTNGDRSIYVAFADNVTGIAAVQYTYDKVNINSMANGGTLTWTTNTNATVWFRAQDGAGNWSNWDSYGPYYVRVDKTAPTGSASVPRYTNNPVISVSAYAADTGGSGLSKVSFPTWSNVNGQDDIVWHDIAGTGPNYSGTINLGSHSPGTDGDYTVHVYAYDNAGNNGNIGIQTVTLDRVSPAIGSITGAQTVNTASGGTVAISASGISDSLSGVGWKDWYYNINGGAWSSYSRDSLATSSSTFNLPITTEGTYTVRIWAYDNASNGTYKDTTVVVDRTAPASPSATISITSNGVNSGTNNISISWPAVSGASSYGLYIFDGRAYRYHNIGNVTSWSSNNANIFPTAVQISAWTNLDADPFRWGGDGQDWKASANELYAKAAGSYTGYSYYTWIHIISLDSVGNMSGSPWAGATSLCSTTVDADAPNVPTAPIIGTVTSTTIPVSVTTVTDKYMTASFPGTGVSASTGYRYKIGTTESTWGAASTTWTGLTPNTVYTISAQAQDGNGNYSAYSTTTTVRTLANIPISLSASDGTSANSITITWGENNNPVGTIYELQMSADQSNWSTVYTGTGLTYTHSGLTYNQTRYYKVRAKNADNIYTSYTGVETGSTITDTIPPTITISAPSKTMAKTGDTVIYEITLSESLTFNISTVVLSGTATTGASVAVTGSGTSYTATVTVGSGDGTLGINVNEGAIIDVAGNASIAQIGTTFIVDNTAPTIGSVTAPSIINTPSGGTVTITLNELQDLGGAGLKEAQFCPYIYKTDQWLTSETIALSGNSVSYELPITEDGNYAVGVYVRDNVLNTSFQYIYITIDRGGLPPLIDISPNGYSWSKQKNVTISVIDVGGKGLAANNSYQYYLSTSNQELIGGSWTNYTPGTQFTIGSGLNGIYYLWVKEIADLVGNKSSAISQAFYFDNISPSASHVLKNNTLNITAIDEGSGVLNIEFPDGTVKQGSVASYNIEVSGTYKFIIKDRVGNIFEYSVECIINNWDKPIINIIYDTTLTNAASRNMTISIDSINPIKNITINNISIDISSAIVENIGGKYNTKVTYTITNNGIYEIVATDEEDKEGYKEIIINNFDRNAPKITITYKEPTIYSIYASIIFEADEKVIVVNQNNITDLIVPGMSEYTVSHKIEKVLTSIKNGNITFRDLAGNDTVVNVEIDAIKYEYVRIGVNRIKAYNNLSINSSFILAQQMENKVKITGGKINQYYGVNASEVDMFMSRSRDIGAVAYLAYAKGTRNIEKNTSGMPIGEDYITKTNQSTTGNIYGIFDLNGGQDEYNAFYINSDQPVLSENGNVLQQANNKYKDVISPSGAITLQDKLRLYKGIAMTEINNFNGVNGILPTASLPFIIRSGLFDYKGSSGEATTNSTFRVTLINK